MACWVSMVMFLGLRNRLVTLFRRLHGYFGPWATPFFGPWENLSDFFKKTTIVNSGMLGVYGYVFEAEKSIGDIILAIRWLLWPISHPRFFGPWKNLFDFFKKFPLANNSKIVEALGDIIIGPFTIDNNRPVYNWCPLSFSADLSNILIGVMFSNIRSYVDQFLPRSISGKWPYLFWVHGHNFGILVSRILKVVEDRGSNLGLKCLQR